MHRSCPFLQNKTKSFGHETHAIKTNKILLEHPKIQLFYAFITKVGYWALHCSYFLPRNSE